MSRKLLLTRFPMILRKTFIYWMEKLKNPIKYLGILLSSYFVKYNKWIVSLSLEHQGCSTGNHGNMKVAATIPRESSVSIITLSEKL